MRRLAPLISIALATAGGTSRADPGLAETTPSAPAPRTRDVVIAANLPFGWIDGNAIAGSVYVGISPHQVLHGNVGTFRSEYQPFATAIEILQHEDPGEGVPVGRTTDLGVGWTYYPRRRFDGFSVELGVLARLRNQFVYDIDTPYTVTRTTTLAGRTLVGWTWLFRDRVFLSVSAGLSVGREGGTETVTHEYNMMTMTSSVGRLDLEAEGYTRLGIAFDL